MPFNITKLVDVTFFTKDHKKTVNFYNTVGLKDLKVPGPTVYLLGDKEFALHPELPKDYPLKSPNTVHISVLVDDLPALCKHLDNKKIAYFGPKDSHLGQKSVHITDPDGRHIEFHQQG